MSAASTRNDKTKGKNQLLWLHMLHTTKDVLIYGLNAENATTELCPPNPNEFEMPASVTVSNQAKLICLHYISN